MNYISTFLNQINRFVCSLNPSEWAVVGVICVVLGVLCMRGYGSRDTY